MKKPATTAEPPALSPSHARKFRPARSLRSLCLLLFNSGQLAAILLLPACTMPPLKGGRATTTGPITQSLAQGQNPAAPSRQDQETIKIRTYTLPAGTRIDPAPSLISASLASTSALPTSISYLPSPISVTEREETRAKTELGAAQKDTARELGAKLASLKAIVWIGVALFIFGLASFAWPPLRAIIGSVTTSAAITLGGIALMVLPTLIVGNELLILGGVGLAVGAWFIAHRHGELRGLVNANTAAAPTTAPQPTQQPS
jgi:hypothetical protein